MGAEELVITVGDVGYYDIVGPNGFLEKLSVMVKNQLPEGKPLDDIVKFF